MLRVLDLFSGIGGFSLGLERTGGFKTIAFCEIEEYPRRVLAKHWPEVPCYHDIRALTAARLAADGLVPDVLCGGFPCQDISVAGSGAGMAGERSGLWSEYARLVGELRPRYVIVENVAALLSNGLDVVLGDLAAIGYDAEWDCIPASALGAPHQRDRIWIVAHPRDGGQRELLQPIGQPERCAPPVARGDGEIQSLGYAYGCRGAAGEQAPAAVGYGHPTCSAGGDVPDAHSQRWNGGRCAEDNLLHEEWNAPGHVGDGNRRFDWAGAIREAISGADAAGLSRECVTLGSSAPLPMPASHCGWLLEPDVGRVANGVPARVDRLKGLGNAVVPQIPQMIGRMILQAEKDPSR